MRVGIAGLGIVAPGAAGVAAFEAALAGPPPSEPTVQTVGDEANLRARRLPKLDRMVLAAAREALGSHSPAGLGLVFGTGYGGLTATVDFLEGMAARGAQFGSPTAFHQSVHHAPAGQLSIALGITGPCLTTSARELSGESALKMGVDLLASRRVEKVLVVAADERVKALVDAYRLFETKALRPVAGEGAAALLLTRGPEPLGIERVELTGQPTSSLRFAEGSGPLTALARRAAEVAGPKPYVSPAGFGGALDELERRSLAEAIPDGEVLADGLRVGLNPSGGLLRLLAAALRLRQAGRTRGAVVHGLSLGGGHGAVVLRHVLA